MRKKLFSQNDKVNLLWFWHGYFKQKTVLLLVVLGMIIAQGVVYQQFIELTENGLRVIFEKGELQALIRVCITVVLIFGARAILSYIVPRISAWIAADAVQKMRRDLIAHMMQLDLSYFEKTNSGEIILRLVNQAQDLSTFVGQTTIKALRDFVTIIIVSGYLMWKSPLLFASALVIIPCVALVVRYISTRIKGIQAAAENAMGAYMTGLDEMSSGMRTVKLSNQEVVEQERLLASTNLLKNITLRLQAVEALMEPSMDFFAALIFVMTIGIGGYMALSPDFNMDGAVIIAFIIGIALIFDPARQLSKFFVRLQASLIILDSVRAIYRERPTILSLPDAKAEFDRGADITLEHVAFGYTKDRPLFSDLNMVFEGGKVTAIVGPTGSGKTTILSLMARLYDPQEGQVRIGAHPVHELRLEKLRQSFSVVSQDIVIFNNSIWENIRYANPKASDEAIWEAARHATIDTLIEERGDKPLGPKGAQLSGGQKQRIAIARAFLRNRPILILDEATSALDQRTEERVRQSLRELSQGKTTIVVAHRLSAVTDADKIYVLEDGHVVETGTHPDLMQKGGLYATLFDAQKRGYGS